MLNVSLTNYCEVVQLKFKIYWNERKAIFVDFGPCYKFVVLFFSGGSRVCFLLFFLFILFPL